jgi:hypothetical protein
MSTQRGSDISILLASHDKRIREASGLLSRLYRLTLLELSITPYKWNLLLTNYLDNLAHTQSLSQDKITNERNNLRKGLSEPDMTFEMLARGLKVLNPKEIHFDVELMFPQNVTLTTTINMISPQNGEQGKLTEMYSNILAMLGKDVNNLEPEIDAYLSNPLIREDIKGRKKGNDKGNLRRELPGMAMTFDVFKKGLRILAPDEVTMTIRLRWNRSRVTKHKLIIVTPKQA